MDRHWSGERRGSVVILRYRTESGSIIPDVSLNLNTLVVSSGLIL